jgi:hypothetical protein
MLNTKVDDLVIVVEVQTAELASADIKRGEIDAMTDIQAVQFS